MSNTKIASAARRAGLAGLLGAAATATVIGFAGAAHADSSTPSANHQLGMYGDPAAAAPYWHLQTSSDCAEMAVAEVVGQVTRHEPTEQQILDVAANTPSKVHPGPVHKPVGGGTSIEDMPVLLAHYGILSAWTRNTTTSAMEQALGGKREVIVIINAETIWRHTQYVDPNYHPGDHAVAVTGIDTKAGVVYLNDSGYRKGPNEQVSIALFEQAWAKSHNLAIVTK